MDTTVKTTEHKVLEMINGHGDITAESHVDHGHGTHGDSFVSLEGILANPLETDFMCEELANRFVSNAIEVVVGSLTVNDRGALSTLIALHLSHHTGRTVLAFDEYKPGGAAEFRFGLRSRKLLKEKRVLVIRGIISNGYSTNKILRAVRSCGGTVVGLGAICDMGVLTEEEIAQIPFVSSLVKFHPRRWNETDCPLCKGGVPINTMV